MIRLALNLVAIYLLTYGVFRVWPRAINLTAARQAITARQQFKMQLDARRFSGRHGVSRAGKNLFIRY
jgi:hypothetical protein